MIVPANPCESCPYRRDVPSGILDRSEYEKLPQYDDGPLGQQSFATFLCHHSQEAVCRGWLTVHCQSVAVRIGMLKGEFTPEQVFAPVEAPLYKSGAEAAAAGIKGIKRPNRKARAIVRRLTEKRERR